MKATSLEQASGLPLTLKGNKLVFGKGMGKIGADVRVLEKMRSVLRNPQAEAPQEFYYMYRSVCIENDSQKIADNSLRYDITVLPPFTVGDEFNKTFGHYHPKAGGRDICYPELYEVLHGRAHYLLQNGTEFLVYDARPGDKCMMLPGFGHITVNPSQSETLVMANWVFPEFSSDYAPIESMRGAEWYETVNGFVKNAAYKKVNPVKLVPAKIFPEMGLTKKPIYTEGVKNPKQFSWLSQPQDFLELFEQYRKG